ncbi:hypothetical protein BKA70DRAFT_519349 [Coprinopsis sp. MPI-PUGE-AT-0042]|nr:hypothetical protein BKA70DRAFT_519349 [Coprinopsis sp. MPI-PUGE-AT-0042]
MESQSRMAATSSTGGGALVEATGAAPITQNVHGVQVHGAPLNIAGGDVHNHVHHHYAAVTSRFPPGWDEIENQRRIQIATLGRATRGTCMWVRQMGTWCIWLEPEGDLKIMWGYGMPGAGKTILASIIIDTLETHAKASNSPICVNYIYFRYSDHTKATIRGFLEVLVKQTIERHPHCLLLLDEAYARHIREKTQPSEDELLALYQRFSGTMFTTFCIFDALDEAPPTLQLEILEKLASVNVKLFVTSRPLKAVEARFPQAHRFKIVAQDQDIDLHIDKEISRSADLRELLEDGGPLLRGEIATSIKEKCGGMFLHVLLQLEALRECTSVREVKETLATFHQDIEELYLQTWQRIMGQTRSKVLLAKKILMWVITATRSLTVEELRNALASCPDTHKFDSSRLVQGGTLIALCRGLVTVEEDTRLVRLVHYTAKDILEQLILETFPHPHALLSAACLARLTDSGIQTTGLSGAQQLTQVLQAEPLLGYAYDSWPMHARKSLAAPLTIERLARFVESCHEFPCCTSDFDTLGPLHLVAQFGLPISFAGSDCLRNPNQCTPRRKWTALHLACKQGHANVVEELVLLPNILVNAVDINGNTALILASRFGHDGAARLLLGHPDININAVDKEGRTALLCASVNGRKGAVSLLLSCQDIDVNVVSRSNTTALILASWRGHQDVVALLLSHPGINVNMTGHRGLTALGRASVNRHEGAVKLLLSHPQVDVNVKDKCGRTSLGRAAKEGGEAIVKLLLTHPSIQVSTRDLEMARAEGHYITVSMLEEFLS